jgi:alpha-glucosidase
MEAYKIFTWNRDRYPDAPGTLRDLKQKGFKTVTIIDPAIKIEKGYSVYEEGLQNGFFAMNPDGLPYINSVWAGKSLFPDFGSEKVRAWWGKHLRDHLSVGVDGIWNDMNEPASAEGEIPDDVIFHDGARPATHAEMHNVYGHFMSRATYESLKEATGKRPFVITRACYAGTQKYATVWTGDNRSLWQQLRTMIPQLCTLGLCGVSFAGTDIGGFLMDTTPELLTRWVEAACFSPLFRNHCNKGARYQEPWRFGEPTLSIYRSYVKLRYAFLPYLYDLFFQGEQTGLPVMRPLALSYENDPKALRCNSQFLVGENLLVAPVLEPGVEERLVYLPQGEWVDIRTGERIRGGASIVAQAPLDVCPMYAKAGSIFPNYEAMDYVGEKPLDTLILKVYRGNGTYRHYEDNGEDFRYRQGEYNEYQFTIREDGTLTGECLHSGYATKYRQFRIEFEGRHYLLPTSESFKLMLS